jgi:hypothetical protein
LLSLIGLAVSALLAAIIANSALWQRQLIASAAGIENRLGVRLVFSDILESERNLLENKFNYEHPVIKQFPFRRVAFSCDMMLLYYYLSLLISAMMCASAVLSLVLFVVV